MDVVIKVHPRLRGNLTTPLLTHESLRPTDLPKDIKLVEVEVQCARHVPNATADMAADSAGTYVNVSIMPVQEGVGEQTRQTSMARRVVNPRWGSTETFTFFVTSSNNSQVYFAIHLLKRPLRPRPLRRPAATISGTSSTGTVGPSTASNDSSSNGPPLPVGARPGDIMLGEGFVDLMALFSVDHGTYTREDRKGNTRKVVVPMRNPITKSRSRCVVILGLRYRHVNETMDTHEDRLYEYQRWTPFAGWSIPGNQYLGTWSTLDGSIFDDDFTVVAPRPRNDSEVVLPWCPFGGWEYSREEESSPHSAEQSRKTLGGSTAKNIPSLIQKRTIWAEGYARGYEPVRRRLWRRVYVDSGALNTGDMQP